jgi:(2S)-methylsuccinyl-CoA dehydrogenase
VAEAKPAVKAAITGADGKIDRKLADEHQHQVHGYGWYAAYAELMNQVAGWAERLQAAGQFGEIEALLAQLLFSEYCAQLIGGVPMNQGEIVRPAHLVTDRAVMNRLFSNGLMKLMVEGGTQAVKTRVACAWRRRAAVRRWKIPAWTKPSR